MEGALDQGTHGWWWLQWLRAAASAQGTGGSDGWCGSGRRQQLSSRTTVMTGAAQGANSLGGAGLSNSVAQVGREGNLEWRRLALPPLSFYKLLGSRTVTISLL